MKEFIVYLFAKYTT